MSMLHAEETAATASGYERAKLTKAGAVAVDTGKFNGRSPKDKYIVRDEATADTVWWTDQGRNDNKPITSEVWDHLETIVGR